MPLKELLEMGRRMERKLNELGAKQDKLAKRLEASIGIQAMEESKMTDLDRTMIVNSDDVLGSITNWNRSRRPTKRRAA